MFVFSENFPLKNSLHSLFLRIFFPFLLNINTSLTNINKILVSINLCFNANNYLVSSFCHPNFCWCVRNQPHWKMQRSKNWNQASSASFCIILFAFPKVTFRYLFVTSNKMTPILVPVLNLPLACSLEVPGMPFLIQLQTFKSEIIYKVTSLYN